MPRLGYFPPVVRNQRLMGALAVLSGCAGTWTRPAPDGKDVGGVGKSSTVRKHTVVGNGAVKSIDVAGGMGQVMDYGATSGWAPGNLRSAHGQGREHPSRRDIKTADVSSVDLSFDATKVFFTMKKSDTISTRVLGRPRARRRRQVPIQPADLRPLRRSASGLGRRISASCSRPTRRTRTWAPAPTSTTTRAS